MRSDLKLFNKKILYDRVITYVVITLTCVDVSVFLHVGLLVKPFAAKLAWVRSRVRMYQQMRGQRGRSFERFMAQFTLETKKKKKHLVIIF